MKDYLKEAIKQIEEMFGRPLTDEELEITAPSLARIHEEQDNIIPDEKELKRCKYGHTLQLGNVPTHLFTYENDGECGHLCPCRCQSCKPITDKEAAFAEKFTFRNDQY